VSEVTNAAGQTVRTVRDTAGNVIEVTLNTAGQVVGTRVLQTVGR
jgi:YD repeat-containing protein